jgi:hypothetical protein
VKIDPKSLVLETLFGRWRRRRPLQQGYAILLPIPSDMPFLLRYALEGLRATDTTSCGQVIVVPDGSTGNGDAALQRVIEEFGDSRVELAHHGPLLKLVVGRVRSGRSGHEFANWAHWAAIVEATNRARFGYMFLHDADAFFTDPDGLERQYRECRDRGMTTLGVQRRIDPLYEQLGYAIPGTWEMMYSVEWARRWSPASFKGRKRSTPHGPNMFDTMLYPQFCDYPAGKVGVMDDPPRLVHFHGTITTYRVYRDRDHQGGSVADVVFRLLLLSVLEDLVPASDGTRLLPTPAALAVGLTDPSAPVIYPAEVTACEYPTFRRQFEQVCEASTFRGDRANRARALLRPFDEHFGPWEEGASALVPGEARFHGIA